MALTRNIYKLGFEISPVILCDGIAQAMPGGMIPIVTLTQAVSLVSGAVGGNIDISDLDKYFCHWRVQTGSTLLNYELAKYPFASQKVAANAILAQPQEIPMIMSAPVNENTGIFTKLATFTALESALEAHANLGGTYIVATPAFIYNNCILTRVQDITPNSEIVPQREWLFNFEKPLITESEAGRAINNFLNKIDAGDVVSGSSWTNVTNAIGNTALGSTVSGVTENITGIISKLMGAG